MNDQNETNNLIRSAGKKCLDCETNLIITDGGLLEIHYKCDNCGEEFYTKRSHSDPAFPDEEKLVRDINQLRHR